MIDIATETVITFAKAADRIPRRRGDKKPHLSTIYRWTERGFRGVRLEFIQIAGTRCTSVQALQRFFDKLTKHHPDDSASGPVIIPNDTRVDGPPITAARRREIERAEQACTQLGI